MNQDKHSIPQFFQWIREQSQFHTHPTEEKSQPYQTWLDERINNEKTDGRAKLRDQNPPLSKLREFENFSLERDNQLNLAMAVVVVGGLLTLVASVSLGYFGVIIFGWATGYVCYKWPYAKIQALDQKKITKDPIPLDVYNTEFTCPLADRSVIKVTVHFQIPQGLARTAAASPYNAPTEIPSDLVQNLNRVTEAKLVIYSQALTELPSRRDIEEHLNYELAQFQDENQISVMRIAVPIAIHVHPDKPKGTHV